MKKYFIIAVFLAFICFVFCHDKNTNEPLPDNTHPQVDIPWPSLADSPWAMYHHDPQSTGRSPYHGPTNGMIKWTFKPDGAIHSAIALDEESNIYFAVCFEKPDLSTSLYSVSSAGELNWKIKLPLGPESQPLITSNETIIIGGKNIYVVSLDGILIRTITSVLSPSPYINIGMDGILYVVGADRTLFALDQTGNIVWQKKTDMGFSIYHSVFSPDGNVLYLYSYTNDSYDLALNAVNASDGTIKWKFQLNHIQTYKPPIIESSGTLYLGSFGVSDSTGVYSINSNGKLNWFSSGRVHFEPTINYDGYLYFDEGDADTKLLSLDYLGNIRWKNETAVCLTSLICDKEGNVYLCSAEQFHAFDKSGNKLWDIQLLGYSTRISPQAIDTNGCIYFGTYAGENSQLYCIY